VGYFHKGATPEPLPAAKPPPLLRPPSILSGLQGELLKMLAHLFFWVALVAAGAAIGMSLAAYGRLLIGG
jgi:hypothetical protein